VVLLGSDLMVLLMTRSSLRVSVQGLRLQMNESTTWYAGIVNEARLCYVSNRTREIANIFRAVFGAAASRVKVVLQGQAGWSLASERLLSCGGSGSVVDALGIGPYFGGELSYTATGDPALYVRAVPCCAVVPCCGVLR
jgi:hypothetical protein